MLVVEIDSLAKVFFDSFLYGAAAKTIESSGWDSGGAF